LNQRVGGKQESSFIAIGSQEEVQPAASSTTGAGRKPSPDIKGGVQTPTLSSTTKGASPASSRSKTHEEERESAVAAAIRSDDSQLSTASRNSAHALEADAFGARLGSGTQEEAEQSKNWMLIAACAAALSLAIGGGILLFHHKSADSAASPTPPAPIAAPVVASQPAEAPQPPAVQPNPKPVPLSASVVRESPIVVNPRPAKELPEAAASEQPEQPDPTPASRKTVPSTFGTLNAHPVSTRQSATGPAAPNLDSAVAPSTEQNLLGIASAPNAAALPPPGFKANAPGVVGGRTKEPQLLTRVLPQYPNLARQAHTEGDVAIEIVVDKAGNVGDAKVISGPTVLRQAAIDAVRRWKYEPSLLDGQPTSVEMLVTIRFRL